MERCGKINASNSGAESWTGIGVVAGFGAVVLIMQWPHGKHRDVNWRSKLLQILQEVRSNCKTRNQLFVNEPALASIEPTNSGKGYFQHNKPHYLPNMSPSYRCERTC